MHLRGFLLIGPYAQYVLIFGPLLCEYLFMHWFGLLSNANNVWHLHIFDCYRGIRGFFQFHSNTFRFVVQLSLQVANSLHFCCKPLGTTHESYATNKSDEVSPNYLLQEQSVLWGWKTFQIVLYAQGNAKFWYIACARGKKRRNNELAWDCGWKNLKRQVRRWCSRWDFKHFSLSTND